MRLHEFIKSNRAELIARCRTRVAARRAPRATSFELEHGVPVFLDQLSAMLSEPKRPAGNTPDSGMDDAATQHGEEMLLHGFHIDQVVHDYGDLCQAITELALARGEPITVPEFATLNRRLDDAIAAAVTEWSRGRESDINRRHAAESNERLGMLGHEMRNQLNTAILALAAIKGGGVAFGGATAAALDRSLIGMRNLIDRTLAEVRLASSEATLSNREPIEVARFLQDVRVSAALEAASLGQGLTVHPAEPGVMVNADRHLLAGAVGNLLQNAFKYSRPGGHVSLRAEARGAQVVIEVEDECGGLPPGSQDIMFRPFEQAGPDRSKGLGLGLAISRKGVEADGGTLTARDIPGHGCVFTITLPRFTPGR